MNKIFKIFAVLAVITAASASCTKEWIKSRTGLMLTVTPDNTYVTKAPGSNAAPAADVSKFEVHIKKVTGEYDKTCTYGELASMIELSEGKYTITVQSPDRALVAWDQPIYAGSEEFEIIDGAVTNLNLKCTIQNMKVSVELSQNLLKELEYYEIRVENEDGYLLWKEAEVQAGKNGFFSVKPLKIKVVGRRAMDHSMAEKEIKINAVAPRDHHKLMLDAKLTGQAQVGGLEIDGTLNDKPIDVIVPGFEDVVPGGDTPGGDGGQEPEVPQKDLPTLEWPANPNFERTQLQEVMSVDLVVKVPGKIKSFVVEVSENFQSAISMIASNPYLDLINDQKAITNLKDVAPDLPTAERLVGKTQVDFPLSGLMPLLNGVGTPGEDYIFTLKVGDEAGNTLTKSLTFYKPL